MKRFISLFLACIITICLFSACNNETKPEPEIKDFGKIFYVSTEGNDENDGSMTSPLATITGAVAKVREYKSKNGLPDGGIKVEFAAGTYKITSQTELTEEDSGESGKPIVYAAAEGAEVIFDGGITLTSADFKPANDEFKAILYSEEAKANVLEADLAAAGIWDADDTAIYTDSWGAEVYRQSLYVNDELQTVARWPNNEYYLTSFTDVTSSTQIPFPEEKAALWANETNIRAYGYPVYDWSSNFFWNLSLEPGTSILNVPTAFDKKRPIFVFNIACELDEPGEYYWDVENNKLYYWPKEDFETAKINFSQFKDSVFKLTDAYHITFDGFTFENLRYNAILVVSPSKANYITVSNCIFRCISSYPISLQGNNITVSGNTLYNLGGGGILVSGGNVYDQIPSSNLITNNLIHDWSQVYTVYNAGIVVGGAGTTISHNELYNAPHEAIAFNGGMNTIEYNHIHNVCKETSDAGAVYSGRRWDWGSNDIRYNYIHDIIDEVHGGVPNGIYLDDSLAFQHVYCNILVNIGGVGITGGGINNCVIENNVICITGSDPMYNNDNGIGALHAATLYPNGSVWQNILPVIHTQLWKYAYPSLLTVVENKDVHFSAPFSNVGGFPGFNKWVNNIVYGSRSYRYTVVKGHVEEIVVTSVNEWQASTIGNNIEYLEDDLTDVFTDPNNGNFFLKEDSRAYRDIIGFAKWDYSLIGIQK